MAKSDYECPHCGQIHRVHEQTTEDRVIEYLPETFLKLTVGKIVADIHRKSGIILGGVFLVDSIKKYLNGKTIICQNCGVHFSIAN